ncbi:MAG TPA: sodium-translocating pyrophosphatase, partial [Verrucomicrobiales bacterium]|nr:sodium-translocating pyrophosphatase [Verrucomicrobiales bacterium]
MELQVFITPLFGVIGLVLAAIIFFDIKKQNAGGGKAEKIAEKIHHGAMVFMSREFKLIALFAIALGLALFLFQKPAYRGPQSIAFFMGCLASSAAGYIGMKTATLANVRTCVAANEKGPARALKIAFSGGAVMGLTVAAMGLLGLGTLFAFYSESASHKDHLPEILEGFAMGASLVALFYRVGGGIFTKAADVGTDLVGKVEAGIPEDDPRNPGVIADNVGDNVGDVAGMGSDIFESYCGAQIATVAIAASSGAAYAAQIGASESMLMQLPLILTTVGIVCSV